MATQPSDRAFVPGGQELDGIQGDLRSEAKCTGTIPFQQQRQQGERLAAIPVRFELAAASPHFCVAFPPNWPIEIWYGEELAHVVLSPVSSWYPACFESLTYVTVCG